MPMSRPHTARGRTGTAHTNVITRGHTNYNRKPNGRTVIFLPYTVPQKRRGNERELSGALATIHPRAPERTARYVITTDMISMLCYPTVTPY
eukprot:5069302-Prymnesium_polylepis.1